MPTAVDLDRRATALHLAGKDNSRSILLWRRAFMQARGGLELDIAYKLGLACYDQHRLSRDARSDDAGQSGCPRTALDFLSYYVSRCRSRDDAGCTHDRLVRAVKLWGRIESLGRCKLAGWVEIGPAESDASEHGRSGEFNIPKRKGVIVKRGAFLEFAPKTPGTEAVTSARRAGMDTTEPVQQFEAAFKHLDEEDGKSMDAQLRDREQFVQANWSRREDSRIGPGLAEALLQIAELRRAHAEHLAVVESREYEQCMQGYEAGLRPTCPGPAGADYAPAAEAYLALAENFKEYRHRDAALYLAGYCSLQSGELKRSIRALETLVEQHPQSRYVAPARMLLGRSYFDAADYLRAIESYRSFLVQPVDDEVREEALYHLGWSCFEEFRFSEAVENFLALLDSLGEGRDPGAGREAMRGEAIECIVNSFLDEDWDHDLLPDPDCGLLRAMRLVSEGIPYEREILERYGDLLFDLGHAKYLKQALTVYGEYLKRYPFDTRNPLVHDRIVYACFELSRLESGSSEEREDYAVQAMAERRRIFQLYGKASAWAAAHRDNAEALEMAAGKVSQTLLEQAQLLHVRAQERKEEEGREAARPHYEEAGEAYRDFLDLCPDHPMYIEMLRRLMDIEMFGLNDYNAAAVLSAFLRDLDRQDNPYRQEAAEFALEARANLVLMAAEARDPGVPVPEKLFEFSEGTVIAEIEAADPKDPTKRRKVTPVEIPQVVQNWLAEADSYLRMEASGEREREYSGMLAYMIGKVHFRYGHFDRAREQFDAVLKEFGEDKPLSRYCFVDMARTYQLENDLDALEALSIRMREEIEFDPHPYPDPNRQPGWDTWRRVRNAGALLEAAEKAEKQGDGKSARDLYVRAASVLVKIVDDNPGFEHSDLALIEAARALERANLYGKAGRLYTRLLEEERFESSDHREMVMMSLAENCEKFFEFSRAQKTFLSVVREYPDGDNVKFALLKAASLLEADQNYLRAADLVEDFIRRFPTEEKLGRLAYLLVRLYEKGRDRDKAAKAGISFVKKHGRNPRLAVQTMRAHLKLGRWAGEDGRTTEARKHFEQVIELYEDREVKPGTKGAHLAAESAFRLAEQDSGLLPAIRIEGPAARQRKLGLKRMERLRELDAAFRAIAGYQSPFWTVAGYYGAGLLWKELSSAFAEAPHPSDLPDDEDSRIRRKGRIRNLTNELEHEAQVVWREGAEFARAWGVDNEWTGKILYELGRHGKERGKHPPPEGTIQLDSDEPFRHFRFVP